VVKPRWASSHVGESHGKAGWAVPMHEAMGTRDGQWIVEVGGLAGPSGPGMTWYRIVGPGVRRYLPSMEALVAALAEQGVDLADLVEVEQRAA
jgi:hypothetical protein